MKYSNISIKNAPFAHVKKKQVSNTLKSKTFRDVQSINTFLTY